MKRRIWNKDELTIAYYVARWGYGDLGLSKSELMRYVFNQTHSKILDYQAANFRYILHIEGFSLSSISAKKTTLVSDLSRMSRKQIRCVILNYICKCILGDVELFNFVLKQDIWLYDMSGGSRILLRRGDNVNLIVEQVDTFKDFTIFVKIKDKVYFQTRRQHFGTSINIGYSSSALHTVRLLSKLI